MLRILGALTVINFVSVTICCGQILDPLPDLPRSVETVRLVPFVVGLPVEQEFVTPVFTQRVGPTDMANLPGRDEVVVTTYGGQAFLIGPNGDMSAIPFLNLVDEQSPSWNSDFEVGYAHGLTSIAFHPDFADSNRQGHRRFYTLEPEKSDSGQADFHQSTKPGNHHQDVLYEYTLGDITDSVCAEACVNSKREVMRITQPGWHHNLGDLLFDDQGLLYIASGDGSTAATVPPFMSDNSLTLETIFGKILRIDPLGNNSQNGKYGVPIDNPFHDGTGANIDEIYAYGLRNPFRLEFDPETQALYASETGEEFIESIERIVPGGNFGWNEMEGRFRFDKTTRQVAVDDDLNNNGQGDFAELHGFVDPIFEYDRDDGRAVVGAVPYRGSGVSMLNGQVVFADFRGELFVGHPETGDARHLSLDNESSPLPFNIHSVNRGPLGEVYLLGIFQESETDFDGAVLKVMATPAQDGDFNGDNLLDSDDVDLLTQAVRMRRDQEFFDLTNNGIADDADRIKWVNQLRNTYFGDANLNGTFDEQDLVDVFIAGEYNDGTNNNSTWSEGDWDGDADFSSEDIVYAFIDGGYLQGPRNALPVPEPTLYLPQLLAVLCFAVRSFGHLYRP